MSNSLYWLIASAVFFALEAFGIPGVGFLFAGFAALLTAGVVSLGLLAETAIVAQWAVFFALTILSAALLWNRMKNWRMNPNSPEYSNIVGTEAVVGGVGLSGDKEGIVLWSGTRMRAKLADHTHAPLSEGTYVTVIRTEGNVLYVAAR